MGRYYTNDNIAGDRIHTDIKLNQSTVGAGGLGIIRGKKVGEPKQRQEINVEFVL